MTDRMDVMKELRAADPVRSSDLDGWKRDPEAEAIFAEIVREETRDTRTAPSPRRRARLALTGVTALIAATAVVLGLLPGTRDGGPPALLGPAGAAEVLRRAASGAADNPYPAPGSGEYAYLKTRGMSYGQWGEGWSVFTTGTRESWYATDGSGRIRSVAGESSFPGPRDRARCEEEMGEKCSEALGNEGFDQKLQPQDHVAGFGDRALTYEELLDLPTDPDELEPMMRAAAADAANPDFQVFVIVGDLLRQPLTPTDLRVAIYEVAARIEGVTYEGTVTDPLGRKGAAVAMVSAGHVTPLPKPGEGDIRREIIFDPESGRYLAEREVLVNRVPYMDAEPGTVISYAAYERYGVVGSTHERP